MLGLPLITGQAETIGESLIHGEHLFLVERENPQALSAGILTLKNNPQLRDHLSQNGYKRAQANRISAIGQLTKSALYQLNRQNR